MLELFIDRARLLQTSCSSADRTARFFSPPLAPTFTSAACSLAKQTESRLGLLGVCLYPDFRQFLLVQLLVRASVLSKLSLPAEAEIRSLKD